MERSIPGEIFRKKSNTLRGITFFPFLPKQPKFSVPFVWITSVRLHVERKRKIHRYKSIPFLLSVMYGNFRTNGKRSWFKFFAFV